MVCALSSLRSYPCFGLTHGRLSTDFKEPHEDEVGGMRLIIRTYQRLRRTLGACVELSYLDSKLSQLIPQLNRTRLQVLNI